MGTNYYAIKKKPRIVEIYDEIHIGKSSCGWKFLFHETKDYHNFEEFKRWLEQSRNEYVIKDEYDEEITPEELLELIEIKQRVNNPDDFKYNKNVDGYRFDDGDFS